MVGRNLAVCIFFDKLGRPGNGPFCEGNSLLRLGTKFFAGDSPGDGMFGSGMIRCCRAAVFSVQIGEGYRRRFGPGCRCQGFLTLVRFVSGLDFQTIIPHVAGGWPFVDVCNFVGGVYFSKGNKRQSMSFNSRGGSQAELLYDK